MRTKVWLVIKLTIAVSVVAVIWFLWSYINRPLPRASALPAPAVQPGSVECDKDQPNSPACPRQSNPPPTAAPPQVLGVNTILGK